MSALIIKPRSRIFHGHDWVYRAEVASLVGEPEDGSVVSLRDQRGRILGSAIYNGQSQIVARRFSRHRQVLDADFFERRIEQANALRDRRGVSQEARRVVWSEADGLPGLIIDKYHKTYVVQTLTLAMDRALGTIKDVLVNTLKAELVVARNDAPVRKAEGMETSISVLHGDESQARTAVTIGGMQFEIDPVGGQKTGFYLDQVANYAEVARHAPGRTVLDCFTNQGAFAIACSLAGATSVRAVEIGEDACALTRKNAERNGATVDVVHTNAFDFLKQAEAEGAKYDLIILDPPTFTRTKGKQADALRGYKELHLRALKMLETNGMLATFCCSHHISSEMFLESVVAASVDAHRSVSLVSRMGASPDHPVLPHIPETEYLKGFLFEALPGR